MHEGRIPLDNYVITKGLRNHPNVYPNAMAQPHVHVACHRLQVNHTNQMK